MECTGDVCKPVSKAALAAKESVRTDGKTLKIVVTSDNICPWCIVGKRRLEEALKAVDTTKVNVQVQWKPFMLDATLPAPGLDKEKHYEKKFGPKFRLMIPRVAQAAAEHGVEINFGGKVGNTLDSHRLVDFAQKKGAGDAAVEAVMNAYFTRNEDISDRSVLVEIAGRAGLDQSEVKRFLDSDEGRKEVVEEAESAHYNGVTGVPYFVINDRFALSGAQDPSSFIGIFKQLGVV